MACARKGNKKMKKKILITLLSAAIIVLCGGFTTFKAVEEHKITYDLDGGFIASDFARSARWCEEIKTPTAEKEHYTLKGWTDGTEMVTTIKHASENIKLTAVFNPEVYTVTFMDGGSEVSKTNYAYGSGISDLSVFAKSVSEKHPYENFVGWNIDDNIVTELSNEEFGDKVATAEFKGKSYSIAYELDGGKTENPDSYEYGEGLESLSDASKSGCVFDGWYSDSDYTNAITSISKSSHKDITLYAKFHEEPANTYSSGTRSSYSRSYTVGNSSSSSSFTSYNVNIGMTIPALNYHVDNMGEGYAYEAENCGGYEWLGYEYWANDSDGSFYKQDIISGEDHTGVHRTSTSFLLLYDHASQGLSGAGWKMKAGDVVYFQGTAYTYSGRCDVLSDSESSTIFSSLEPRKELLVNGYRAVLKTCTEDNTANYVLYLY